MESSYAWSSQRLLQSSVVLGYTFAAIMIQRYEITLLRRKIPRFRVIRPDNWVNSRWLEVNAVGVIAYIHHHGIKQALQD